MSTNAADTLAKLRAEWEADTNKHVEALTEIQQALGLPATPPAPPVPPPPPPPPSLAVVNAAYASYLFAGFTGLGLTDVVRNRLRLRSRQKVAVRV